MTTSNFPRQMGFILKGATLAATLGLAGCGASAPESEDTNLQNPSLNEIGPPQEASEKASTTARPPSAADRARVCRAMVADMGGYSPAIVKVVSDQNEIVRVRYKRPDDGKQWTTECRFDGDRVVWRTVDAFGRGTGLGRWRESAADEVITYSLSGNNVTIATKYSDGSSGSETYTVR